MANKINLEELPQLTVGEMVDLLSMSFVSLVRSKLPFSSFPSVMLWGQPGVGKSQGVRQIAAEIEKETQKKVVVTDVRLLLFNPIDLRGIPVANEERTLAVWLKPKIFAMDSSDDVVNILFLDEISAAPQSVQAAAYQITLDRAVGEHKLPDNCIVMAAGNRTSDKSVANKMPKALANRLLHLEIKTSFKAWRDWAFRKKVNPMVIGFLSWKNSYLNTFDPSKDELAFATPRSYEMLSNLLWVNKDKDVEDLFPLISGLIGTGIASEFVTWCKTYKDLPKPKDIFDGKNIEAP
nr:AAA family ATPase [Bacilli bacterium]